MCVLAKGGWRKASILTIADIAFIVGLVDILNLEFPSGVLQTLIDLRWLFR